MGRSTHIATIFGIPIRVHITLWVLLPLIALNLASGMGKFSLFWGLLAAIGLFASVALHELGHSVVALAKGCRVREILLLPIGGMAQLDRMPRRPRDEFQVAIAGPAVSLILALLFGGLSTLLGMIGLQHLQIVCLILSAINLGLALFNLLPSFPMDGGRIFRAWMTPKVGRLEATRKAAKIGRYMAIAFGLIGLFNFNLFLVAIAVFIYMAAGAEYRMVQTQEGVRQGFGSWAQPQDFSAPPPDQVIVSPPPYEKGRRVHVARGGKVFEDLFKEWN
jgi:Zn-dependent protease